MNFPELKEAEAKLSAKRSELAGIFADAGPEIDMSKVKGGGDAAEKVANLRNLNDEIDDLAKKAEDLRVVAKAAEAAAAVEDTEHAQKGSDEAPAGRAKSFGEAFIDSGAFKTKGSEAVIDVSLKALLDTTGIVPETNRTGRLVDFATRPIELLDLIPMTTTAQAAVVYMVETTFTNAAAETAEGGLKPEAALALTETTNTVRKIAVWLPVTDETLEDTPRVRDYLNNRLPFMVNQRLSQQIISGTGVSPNLRGVLNTVGIQTQAKGADPTPDAVYKAITKVEVVGQAMPDAFVVHPNDWQDIRLLRTADGIYIWGNPSEAGPERIWGLRVIKAQASTENTGIVGDFGNFSELAVRSGMEVAVSDQHADFFVTNKQAVRAEMRAAFLIYRPTAFCTVTGI